MSSMMPHSGTFYYTKLLLPALLRGATTSSDGKARVVNTSSSALYFSKLDYNTFRDGPSRVKKGTTDLYGQSKFVGLTNVMTLQHYANEFTRA
jgi:retinol dehydrogenase 12